MLESVRAATVCTLFLVCAELESIVFRIPALRREQKRVSFGVLRCAGSKKGSLSGLALRREQKALHFGGSCELI